VREALTELSPGRPLVLDRKVRAVDGAGWRWLALRGKVMAGPDGLRVDGTAWDATELHALAGEREAAVEAQGALLTEVNHRVRNSLQLLSALLALQARRATSPEARAALAEARDRTADVARLHQRLYREGRTATVRISELLADLARDAGGGRGKVRFHGPGAGAERNVPTDRALSLGVMAAELLRAAGAGSQESVRLDLRFEGAPETLLIRVSGPGPTGPATIAQEVTGLLAAQLGADVNTGTLADVAFTEVRMPLRAGEANQGAHEAENGE
jgi:two-component sensor histidine kinase